MIFSEAQISFIFFFSLGTSTAQLYPIACTHFRFIPLFRSLFPPIAFARFLFYARFLFTRQQHFRSENCNSPSGGHCIPFLCPTWKPPRPDNPGSQSTLGRLPLVEWEGQGGREPGLLCPNSKLAKLKNAEGCWPS